MQTKRGEIATLLVVIGLVVAAIGTIVGSANVNQKSTYRSGASEPTPTWFNNKEPSLDSIRINTHTPQQVSLNFVFCPDIIYSGTVNTTASVTGSTIVSGSSTNYSIYASTVTCVTIPLSASLTSAYRSGKCQAAEITGNVFYPPNGRTYSKTVSLPPLTDEACSNLTPSPTPNTPTPVADFPNDDPNVSPDPSEPQEMPAPASISGTCSADASVNVSWPHVNEASYYSLRIDDQSDSHPWPGESCGEPGTTNGDFCKDTIPATVSFKGIAGHTYRAWVHSRSGQRPWHAKVETIISCPAADPSNNDVSPVTLSADCRTISQGLPVSMGSRCGNTNYSPLIDINNDGVINSTDQNEFASHKTDVSWCTAQRNDHFNPCACITLSQMIASTIGKGCFNQPYNPALDVNNDGTVDSQDQSLVNQHNTEPQWCMNQLNDRVNICSTISPSPTRCSQAADQYQPCSQNRDCCTGLVCKDDGVSRPKCYRPNEYTSYPTVGPTITLTPSPIPVGTSQECQALRSQIDSGFGSQCGVSSYNIRGDINNDRAINLADMVSFGSHVNEVNWCRNQLNDTTNPCQTAPASSNTVVDINNDGIINLSDYGSFRASYIRSSGSEASGQACDLNLDNRCNALDFSLFITSFSRSLKR